MPDQLHRSQERILRLERELLGLRKLAALGSLATGMAHDFNNVLAAISGYAELISRRFGEVDPAVGRYTDVILSSCNRASEMVDHLKMITRQERKGVSLFDAAVQMEELKPLLARILPVRYRVEWLLQLGSVQLVGDREAFQGAFLHLLVMVREVLPKGGLMRIRDVYLPADNHQPQGYYGIEFLCDDPQLNRMIMDSIIQKRPEQNNFSVSGSGFHVVRETVENWGGWVRLQWDGPTAAHLIMAFPLLGVEDPQHRLDAENQLVLGLSESHAEANSSNMGSPRILVVEDDPFVQHMLSSLLGSSAKLVLCTSAEEARKCIENLNFSGALVDHGLPGEDGVSFLNFFKESFPKVPCALMSGDPNADYLLKECDDSIQLLAKPFEFSRLKEWIACLGR